MATNNLQFLYCSVIDIVRSLAYLYDVFCFVNVFNILICGGYIESVIDHFS